MKFKNEKLIRNFSISLCIGNLVAYFLFHISYLMIGIENQSFASAFEYIRTYLTKSWEFLFPCLIFIVMITEYSYIKLSKAFISGAVLSLSRFCYGVPYYYMLFISRGYDSIESIGLSFPASLLMSILTFAEASLMFCVALAILKYKKRKDMSKLNLWQYSQKYISQNDFFDFSLPISQTLIAVCGVKFIIILISEIISTVKFFIKYGSSFSLFEILTIMFSYIFLLFLFVFSYFVLSIIQRKIIKNRLSRSCYENTEDDLNNN